ncbi:MAG: hypothetical protein J6U19_07290, partial [Oscillospiraceae bacterium]|nr:hypothetical protein [Oscillospiraceae bacterium]
CQCTTALRKKPSTHRGVACCQLAQKARPAFIQNVEFVRIRNWQLRSLPPGAILKSAPTRKSEKEEKS